MVFLTVGCALLACLFIGFCFFFFKQKTAYEMRISDWSSDVCSSDLAEVGLPLKIRITTLPSVTAVPAEKYSSTLDTRQANVNCFKIGRASCRERVCQYV